MAYSHAKVDLSRVPDGVMKNTFIHFAEQYNALVDGANEMKSDLDQISGETPEEKAEMHQVLAYIRAFAHYLHSKRFNLTLIGLQTYIFCGILERFGIMPKQVRQLFETLIQILQKVS